MPKSDLSFDHIGLQEAQLLYPVLLQNAQRHHTVAQNIAATGEYGIANAHLVMAAENYIQALSVYFAGWGLPVAQIKKLTRFFDEKHEGYTISPVIIMVGNYIKALYKVFESLTQSFLKLEWLQLKDLLTGKLNPLQFIKQGSRYADWWQNAQILKTRGLYVQFDVELHTPEQVTEKDYTLSLEILQELAENCHSTIAVTQKIPEKQRKQFLKWMKNYVEPLMSQAGQFSTWFGIGK